MTFVALVADFVMVPVANLNRSNFFSGTLLCRRRNATSGASRSSGKPSMTAFPFPSPSDTITISGMFPSNLETSSFLFHNL